MRYGRLARRIRHFPGGPQVSYMTSGDIQPFLSVCGQTPSLPSTPFPTCAPARPARRLRRSAPPFQQVSSYAAHLANVLAYPFHSPSPIALRILPHTPPAT